MNVIFLRIKNGSFTFDRVWLPAEVLSYDEEKICICYDK